ncbi:Protein O-mannosyl-transferase TMTC2, partial [Geodia barretti]
MHCTSRETARVLASLGTLGLALALYANSLAGDFVFDDHSAIQVNPDVRTNTPLSSVFKNDFWGLPLSHAESHKSYRPLTVLSFRLNHHLHGLWAPGFHAVNVAAHAGVCVLFFWACLGLGASLAPSLSASLLFASHPIHTEAVANIVGRSELFAAIFFLLALISYQRAGRKDTTTPSAWIFLTVALSAVSLLCKEQGVTVLGLCLVLEAKNFLLKPEKIVPVQSKNRISWTGHLLRSSVVLSAIAALLFIRIYLIGRGTPTFVDSDNPAAFSPHWKTRFLTYSYLCALNVWLLLLPSQLCHDWSMGSIPLVESVADYRILASLSLLAVTLTSCTLLARRVISHKRVRDCGWTELSRSFHAINSQGNKNLNNNNTLTVQKLTLFPTNTKKRPSNLLEWKRWGLRSKSSVLLLVSLSWVVIPFLPASNLFFPVGFVVAERVLYLPSMGFCLLVALSINSFRTKTRKNHAAIAVSLLVLVFSAKTVSRNSEWGTSRGIVTAALKTFPGNAKLHMSMGNILAQQVKLLTSTLNHSLVYLIHIS